MSSLASSLRTMHLVESLAVALYRGPQSLLKQKSTPLYDAFVDFEAGELQHRETFSRGLAELEEDPFFFAGALSWLLGWVTYLIVALFGVRALLYFEIVIEHIAIRHYGKILSRNSLPAAWQEKVRSIQHDEIQHIKEMKRWLTTLR